MNTFPNSVKKKRNSQIKQRKTQKIKFAKRTTYDRA